jgi:protein-S-isoprenylcysteine O-methyltransferase Ste14
MTTEPLKEHPGQGSDMRQGLVKWGIQAAVIILVQAIALFLSAGRLDWAMGWTYIGLLVLNQLITALALVPTNPELLADRVKSEGPRDLDRVLAGVMFLYGPLLTVIVAGLDQRFGWSPALPLVVQSSALAVALLGSLCTIWAMAANRHFYGVFHIAREQGHTVATAGPYRIVRHPGYLGAAVFDLAVAIALGSLWALIPAALTVVAIAVRTALEDRSLQAQLDGYEAYSQQTRYRLVPKIW